MRFRNGAKAVIFCMVAVILYGSLYRVFSWKDTGGAYLTNMENFYGLEDDVADVLFYGSSHCYCSVNPAVLWEQRGIAGYNMGISGQDFVGSYYGIREALKTQKPRVICLEMYGSAFEGYENQGNLYRNLLEYRPSLNYWNAVNTLAKEEERQAILWKWPIIHTRYSELTKQDFQPDAISRTYMGYTPGYHVEDIGEIPVYQVTESEPIGYEEEWLRKIIALTKEEGVQLLFFHVPYQANEQFWKRCQYVKEIAAENGIPFLDMMEKMEELGVDTAWDFSDWGHMNEYGAWKVSSYLGQYLAENYGLEDRRGTEGYGLWDENRNVWRRLVQNHELQQITDLETYLASLAGLQGYTTVLITEGAFLAAGAEDIREELADLGVGERFLAGEGAWVIEDGIVLYEAPKEGCFHYMEIGESDLLVHANDEKLHVIVDRVEYDRVDSGIGIVLYDNVLGMVADAVGFQAAEGYTCVR